ncbi:hypothetical protein ACE38W_17245 [Chitinophaga sp. Hz27]|uniref:DUF6881 domain-containing protein n=1 Tax=Chitinophaga sp. Hz27 TaxID=3347169 RepID=UPI0035DD9DE4
MQYVKIYWLHREEDEAEVQLIELDELRFECRKIELYPDGTFGIANSNFNFGGTALSDQPLPQLENLGNDHDLVAESISHEGFENTWYRYYNFLTV